MVDKQLNELPRRTSIGIRALALGAAFVVTTLGSSLAQAFPELNLIPGTPDIVAGGIDVDYVGTNAGGVLNASGLAIAITPPGSPGGNIFGPFNINANIDFNAMLATGTLSIGGTNPALGFTTGSVLTGEFSSSPGNQSFGAGPTDPLEFLFDITGGDAAGLFGGIGSTAGVILSQSGYTGSFDSNFSSTTGLADTFGVAVPEPGTLGLVMSAGGLLVGLRRRRHTTS